MDKTSIKTNLEV